MYVPEYQNEASSQAPAPPPEIAVQPPSEGNIATAEQPLGDQPGQEEPALHQDFKPTDTVEVRRFSAPHVDWDPARYAPSWNHVGLLTSAGVLRQVVRSLKRQTFRHTLTRCLTIPSSFSLQVLTPKLRRTCGTKPQKRLQRSQNQNQSSHGRIVLPELRVCSLRPGLRHLHPS